MSQAKDLTSAQNDVCPAGKDDHDIGADATRPVEGAMNSGPQQVALAHLVEQLRSHLHAGPAPALREVVESFETERFVGFKPSTIESKELYHRRLVKRWGDVPIDQIGVQHGVRLRSDLRDRPGTAYQMIATLRALLTFAEDHGWVSAPHPLRKFRGPRIPRRSDWYTAEEVQALRRSAGRHCSSAVSGVIHGLALTGCRLREIAGLQWLEVDIPARVLRLRDTKTGPAVVPLALPAVHHLSTRERTSEVWVYPSQKNPHRAISSQAVREGMRVACLSAGIRALTPHAIRHSWVTEALLNGVPIAFVQRVVRHSSAYMTETYGHLVQTDLFEACDTVAAKMGGA